MSRKVLVWICAALGLLMLVLGWLVPAHLKAVDAKVVERAGGKTPTLVERGLALTRDNQLGAAQLLLEEARLEAVPDRENLRFAVTNLATQHPGWLTWGGGERHLEVLFMGGTGETGKAPAESATGVSSEPLTEWVVKLDNRERVLDFLRSSQRPAVQELLRTRSLTNTVLLPASESSSGQAFDAAVSIAGLLLEEKKLTGGLGDALFTMASQANAGGDSQPFEQALIDLMSLGQRFNWGQVVTFMASIQDAETLRLLGTLARKAEGQLPALFSAVQVSGQPAEVARYVMNFSQTGLRDLSASLRSGVGGVNEVLQRDQRLYDSSLRQRVAGWFPFSAFFGLVLDYGWRAPGVALAIKWLLYLASGFLLAAAMHFAWPAVSALERPLQVRGFHLAREALFALGFLLVVLLLNEPFLSQESQRIEFPFRVRLPLAGAALPTVTNNIKTSFMNKPSLLTLLLFFVLQALIFTGCLVKLAEIRRQRVPARVKLKLLENEDHLFDAGLYLGFAGTIVSLILVSLGVIQQSLMAAYSSTSFGIIFVVVFKIFFLRPARRVLLLEAETAAPEPGGRAATSTPAAAPAYAAHS
jgi:hypothetical protein